MKLILRAITGALLLLAVLAVPAAAQDVQTLKYEYGPIKITPGQNTIEIEDNALKPPVDGWITRFKPDLVRADGSVPRVDVIHLHHGVWVSNFKPLFAAGEEKTEFTAPPGFGWRYKTSDRWLMNHMIHNLTPTEEEVYITYELDFIPATSPAAAGTHEIETAWNDAVGGLYPVFDAKRGRYGGDKKFTYPQEDPDAPPNGWRVPADGALVGAGDVAVQSARALENAKTALAAVGATLDDVVHWTVLIVDGVDLAAAYQTIAAELASDAPALVTAARVAGLGVPGALVEISAVAAVMR